jgi:hypothetical protein
LRYEILGCKEINTPEIHRIVSGFLGEACWRKVIATKGKSGKNFQSVKP